MATCPCLVGALLASVATCVNMIEPARVFALRLHNRTRASMSGHHFLHALPVFVHRCRHSASDEILCCVIVHGIVMVWYGES